MLYIIFGNLGSGKTLLLTYIACKLSHKRIYANFNIKRMNCHYLEAIDLINLPNEVEVLLDEGYSWLESRISGSDLNRYLSYLYFQSRKRNNNFYITVQMVSSLDKRYRNQADYIIEANLIGTIEKPSAFTYTIIRTKDLKSVKKRFDIQFAKKYFKLFDTKQIVRPFNQSKLEFTIRKDDPKKMIEYCKEIAEKVKENTTIFTHNSIKMMLMELGYDKVYEPTVYSILHRDF